MTKTTNRTVYVEGTYSKGRVTKIIVRDSDEHGGWITKRAYNGALKRLGLSTDCYQTLRVASVGNPPSDGYTITVEPNFAIIR